MSKELLSDELWEIVEPLLSDETSKPQGGRPLIDDRSVLAGLIFVLKSGILWEMLPKEMGCNLGSSCWRRLRDWQEAGVWEEVHRLLLDRLGEADRKHTPSVNKSSIWSTTKSPTLGMCSDPPGGELGGVGRVPLRDEVRDGVGPHGQHPRLHPVHGGQSQREPLGHRLGKLTAHPDRGRARCLQGTQTHGGACRVRRAGRSIA